MRIYSNFVFSHLHANLIEILTSERMEGGGRSLHISLARAMVELAESILYSMWLSFAIMLLFGDRLLCVPYV